LIRLPVQAGIAFHPENVQSVGRMAPLSGSSPRHRWPTWAAAAVVGLAVWFVFRRVAEGALLQWDDDINVLYNTHVHGLSWENVRWMFTDAQYMRRYLPLGWLRWAADYQFYGAGPRSFHEGNLIFHVADAVLLFALIRRFLRLERPTADPPLAWAALAGAIGALSWAIHPLRTETVAWISTGQYCQLVFFLLLSILSYLAFSPSPAGPASWRSPAYWISVLTFGLSLLSYPAALGYAGVLLVLDILILGRCPARGRGRDSERLWIWIEKIPFVVVTAAIMAATVISRYEARGIWQPPPTLAEFGLGSRLMQAFYVWAYYLWKPLWPVHLAPVYTTLVQFNPLDWPFVASLAAVLAITGILVWRRRRWPGILALWLCHLVLLVPMLGLSEHPHYTSDRYCYLASIPWSVGLAVVVFRLWSRSRLRAAVVAAAAAALAACAVASAAQVGVWRDSETLFRYVLARLGTDPYRYDILTRLGKTLWSEGRLPEAEASFREAVQARPEFQEARGRLGLILFQRGRTDEAAEFLGAAARLDAQDADARTALVGGLLKAGLLGEAVEYCEDAARLAPGLPDAQGNLGVVLDLVGRQGEALAHFAEAVRLAPNSPDAHFTLGLELRKLRRTAEARAQFEAALRLQPNFPAAREALR
jgi:Flp pilus assembly protein TadD